MKPNLLIILTDQQNARMLGCAGNRYVRTPAMDGLAAEGVRFDRAYCTNPVCVPSRFSLMTGRMPSETGICGDNLSAQTLTITETVQAGGLGHCLCHAGYETLYGGKVHLPRMSAHDIGFDVFCKDERDELANECADFLRRRGTDRPFCLVASFINPHDICYMGIRDFAQTAEERHQATAAYKELASLDAALARPDGVDDPTFFADYCPPLPPNFEPQADEPEALHQLLAKRPFRLQARQQWTERRWREHRWAYARLTESVDRQIGGVLDALRRSAHNKSTVVIMTSDHGDMDGAHRMEHKSALYDEACRIPLIIRPPGGTRGRVDRTHLVSSGLDLLPTCSDWAGGQPPTGLKGQSLRPLVEEQVLPAWRQAVPVESEIGRAIVTQRYKYCRYNCGKDCEQVMDLEKDPWEKVNLFKPMETTPLLGELRRIFDTTFEELET